MLLCMFYYILHLLITKLSETSKSCRNESFELMLYEHDQKNIIQNYRLLNVYNIRVLVKMRCFIFIMPLR